MFNAKTYHILVYLALTLIEKKRGEKYSLCLQTKDQLSLYDVSKMIGSNIDRQLCDTLCFQSEEKLSVLWNIFVTDVYTDRCADI